MFTTPLPSNGCLFWLFCHTSQRNILRVWAELTFRIGSNVNMEINLWVLQKAKYFLSMELIASYDEMVSQAAQYLIQNLWIHF
jgi:hypothetical protein